MRERMFVSQLPHGAQKLMATQFEIDAHRIAADAFEACENDPVRFRQLVLDRTPKDWDQADEMLSHCMLCFSRWQRDGVTKPTGLTEVICCEPMQFSALSSFSPVEQNMPYEFQPRVPIDHALKFAANIRSGDFDRGDNLILVGAISGEIGALMKQGFSIGTLGAVEVPSTIDGCIAVLESLASRVQDESTFDPTPWIPIILKLIELWMSRRGASYIGSAESSGSIDSSSGSIDSSSSS